MRLVLLALAVSFVAVAPLAAQEVLPNKAEYVKRYKDPVLKEMEAERKADAAARKSETAGIRTRLAAEKKKKRDARKTLRFDFGQVEKPASPAAFKSAFYFPPVAQYYTGTCWCFAGTSFLESEVARLTGKRIKLSEMHTVYYEYLEKARRYIQRRGASELGEGSESDAVVRIVKKYGAVPRDAYRGVVAANGRHDHAGMFREIQRYLKFVNANDYWDEARNLDTIRLILSKYMGPPPTTFAYQGKHMTPRALVQNVLAVNLDDYVVAMSTTAVPFHTKGLFDVPDNWWRCADYHNLPLEQFYSAIKHATAAGYTLALGGDVSEPGYNGFEDAAIVPDFDIPQTHINQSAREFRFYNRTTTDDHAIHLVGHTRVGGRDWFLIKDSARGCRHGKCKGYYFYRDDYVRLKMLTFLVHKDALKPVEKSVSAQE